MPPKAYERLLPWTGGWPLRRQGEPAHHGNMGIRFGLGVIFFCWAVHVSGHGMFHERIGAASRQIECAPQNAILYLRRGELYRNHGDWQHAETDYNLALQRDPSLDTVYLCRGIMWHEAGRDRLGRKDVEVFLKSHPNHPGANLYLARILRDLGRMDASVSAYTRAISVSTTLVPEIFLERTSVLQHAGRLQAASGSIQDGLQRLGNLVTLELAALELDIQLQAYQRAIDRVDRRIQTLVRKESWLLKKAKILERAHRTAEAVDVYRQTLDAIMILKPARRNTPAVRALQREVEGALARLETGDHQDGPRPAAQIRRQIEEGIETSTLR